MSQRAIEITLAQEALRAKRASLTADPTRLAKHINVTERLLREAVRLFEAAGFEVVYAPTPKETANE